MNQYTAGTWLIQCTKHDKDNQMESLDSPVEYRSR